MEKFIEGATYISWLKDQKWQVLERIGNDIMIIHDWSRTLYKLPIEEVIISQNGDVSEMVRIPGFEGEKGDRVYADSRMN